MSRNIMLMSASDVLITTKKSRNILAGSKGCGIPAISEPTVTRTRPAITAFSAPARLKPAISSNLVIGVTKYPS